MEVGMIVLGVRVSQKMLTEIDNMIPLIEVTPEGAAAGEVSRSVVLRLAVDAGLDVLKVRARKRQKAKR